MGAKLSRNNSHGTSLYIDSFKYSLVITQKYFENEGLFKDPDYFLELFY